MEAHRFENLTVELEAGCAWITINRPAKLNALNRATIVSPETAAL